jgi:hypothetical protein
MEETELDGLLDGKALSHSVITAVAWQGYTVTTEDGRPATLAVVDEAGCVVESGPEVIKAAWEVAVMSYRRFLIGEGALRIYSKPTGLFQDEDPHKS